MCDPVSIGLGALSTVSSAQAQQAQIEAQNAAYEENVRSSVQAKIDADRQLNLKRAQAEEAAAEQKLNDDLQTQELVARSVVAGAESGVTGSSNASIIQNIMRQGLQANTMVSQNLGRELAQIGEEGLGQTSRYQSRINSVSMGGDMNPLGAIASGVSTGLSAAGSFSKLRAAGGGSIKFRMNPFKK